MNFNQNVSNLKLSKNSSAKTPFCVPLKSLSLSQTSSCVNFYKAKEKENKNLKSAKDLFAVKARLENMSQQEKQIQKELNQINQKFKQVSEKQNIIEQIAVKYNSLQKNIDLINRKSKPKVIENVKNKFSFDIQNYANNITQKAKEYKCNKMENNNIVWKKENGSILFKEIRNLDLKSQTKMTSSSQKLQSIFSNLSFGVENEKYKNFKINSQDFEKENELDKKMREIEAFQTKMSLKTTQQNFKKK